jgi:hypothetical protein
LAKRCELLPKAPAAVAKSLHDNAASKMALQYINRMILNYDFDAGNQQGALNTQVHQALPAMRQVLAQMPLGSVRHQNFQNWIDVLQEILAR